MTQFQIPAVLENCCGGPCEQTEPYYHWVATTATTVTTAGKQLWTCFFWSLPALPENQLQTDSCNKGNTVRISRNWRSEDTPAFTAYHHSQWERNRPFLVTALICLLFFCWSYSRFFHKKHLKCISYSRESFDLKSFLWCDFVSKKILSSSIVSLWTLSLSISVVFTS